MAEKATMRGAPATLMTMHVVIDEPVRNVGPACVLALPGMIGLAQANGPFIAMKVPNLGVDVCKNGACHYTYPTSVEVHSGQSFRIVLNAWWWLDADSSTPAPCEGRIRDASRAIFPVADGAIEIVWDGVLEEVCADPNTVSVGLELLGPGATASESMRARIGLRRVIPLIWIAVQVDPANAAGGPLWRRQGRRRRRSISNDPFGSCEVVPLVRTSHPVGPSAPIWTTG